jgi:hypothetical protein
MTNDWYTADKAHLLKALKMATWRNGDAKLQAAGVQGIDEFIMGRLYEPVSQVMPLATGVTYLPKFKTTSYLPGTWEEILYFQTAMNLYPAMGICNTTEATPNVHDITIRTTQTATNQGRHFERENITDAESERIDIVGMMLNSLHIECSEASPVAVQHNKWGCAFTKNSSTDDIAAASLTDVPFKWSNFTFPTFTYNYETVEADIVGWSFDVINTLQFTGLDTNGYYTKAKYIPLTFISTSLEIIPYGKNAFELIRTKLEDYTADPNNLNLIVKCGRPAASTTDFVQWTHDDLYCQPYIIASDKRPSFTERYILVMSQLDTGSCAIQAKDQYNDNYYENP